MEINVRSLRSRNLLVIYDDEIKGRQIGITQRAYFDSSLGEITPLTSKFLERVSFENIIPTLKPIKGRRLLVIFRTDSRKSSLSRFFTLVPYLPGSDDFKEQIRQTLLIEGIASVVYQGQDDR